jgi:hypothetical protein
MSTAERKTGRQLGPWANLVICGGLSWGVNFWHATHATSAGAHVGTALALLCATGPVFSAGFASHNMSRSGGGNFKKLMTYIVFAMGMALSITAQAEAVSSVFGNIYLGVTFALMLDLSAFMSLHSIMSAPAAKASAGAPVESPVESPVRTPVSPPVTPPAGRLPERLPERLPTARQAPAAPPVKAPAAPPAARPKNPRKAAAAKPKMSPEEVKTKTWELLKENPEMSAPELARALGKSPTSGHVRDMKAKVLEEMRDAGEIPSVRAIGA